MDDYIQTSVTRNQYLGLVKILKKAEFTEDSIEQLPGADQEGDLHDEVVTKVNDDNTKVTMDEILKDLKVDTTETIKTNTEKKVNPSLYEPLTPFVDLVIKEDDLMSWIVKDEAGPSEQPNLVIKGEFKGMGPLAIFTKDAK